MVIANWTSVLKCGPPLPGAGAGRKARVSEDSDEGER
jgi:hypothetical protein